MSVMTWKAEIEPGDLVLCLARHDLIYPVYIEKDKTLHLNSGSFDHSRFIGKKFGSRIPDRRGRNFLLALHPCPDLWTVALPHRTQILYESDISVILLQLALCPGSLVIECGTGSGALTTAMARAVAPIGHIFTFEYNDERVLQAQVEFGKHGMIGEGKVVTVTGPQDVCEHGFRLSVTDGQSVMPPPCDAMILDLPTPWSAIPFAPAVLKRGAKICCFSPCMEQVMRTNTALSKFGFTSIVTSEIVLRKFRTRLTSFVTMEDLAGKGVLSRREQIQSHSARARGQKRRPPSSDRENAIEDDSDESASKKQKIDEGLDITESLASTDGRRTVASALFPECRGHTGYLTFATFFGALTTEST